MRVPAHWLAFTVLAACSDPSRMTASDGEAGGTTADTTADTSDITASPTDASSSTGDRPTSGNSDSMTGGTDTGDVTTASATDPTDTATSETTDTGDETSGGAVPGAFCAPIPACDAAPPKLPGQEEESSGYSRGRDMMYVEGDDQWILAKFTKWGFPADKDITGGTVHVFLDRGCSGDWIELGTTITTDDGDHPTIEGVDDSGGRVYFKIPAEQTLEPGRHRVHLIEDDEWETAELLIDIVPAGAPFFVSDVDGTLTTSENEEAWDFLVDNLPDANAFAAQALTLLANKGYRPMYITARPEWLDRRTRQFVATRNFPPGIIHTTIVYGGANGDAAAAYKTGEFAMLAQKGLVPSFVFGNKASDGTAFDNAGVQPLDHRIFFQYTDVEGGRRIESYEELLGEFAALPDLCK
ncbi:MAG: phosphatidylinositol transfer protein [Nannocystis sp.]|nr:hypothetical protein [Nannocystis sp.]MBA3547624.1 phosphatidylinositol transfer protein [Nannocystis sp.]